VSVCQGLCQAMWDRTAKWLYITRLSGDPAYALPLQHSGLPSFPPNGISTSEELAKMKVPVIAPEVFESGGTPAQYAYTRNVEPHAGTYIVFPCREPEYPLVEDCFSARHFSLENEIGRQYFAAKLPARD